MDQAGLNETTGFIAELIGQRYHATLRLHVTAAGTGSLSVLAFGGQEFGPCLVPQKFFKIFQIPRHIESLDVCIEY